MLLSDFAQSIRNEIGDAIEEDDTIDPRVMVRIGDTVVEVTDIKVNRLEIIFSPRRV